MIFLQGGGCVYEETVTYVAIVIFLQNSSLLRNKLNDVSLKNGGTPVCVRPQMENSEAVSWSGHPPFPPAEWVGNLKLCYLFHSLLLT